MSDSEVAQHISDLDDEITRLKRERATLLGEFRRLLTYTGGSDQTAEPHPITRAWRAYRRMRR